MKYLNTPSLKMTEYLCMALDKELYAEELPNHRLSEPMRKNLLQRVVLHIIKVGHPVTRYALSKELNVPMAHMDVITDSHHYKDRSEVICWDKGATDDPDQWWIAGISCPEFQDHTGNGATFQISNFDRYTRTFNDSIGDKYVIEQAEIKSRITDFLYWMSDDIVIDWKNAPVELPLYTTEDKSYTYRQAGPDDTRYDLATAITVSVLGTAFKFHPDYDFSKYAAMHFNFGDEYTPEVKHLLRKNTWIHNFDLKLILKGYTKTGKFDFINPPRLR